MKLKELYKATCFIGVIHSRMFDFEEYTGERKHPEAIVISGKSIDSINEDKFKLFSSVQSLTIDNTSLRTFPKNVKDLINIKEIVFSNNLQITCIDELGLLPNNIKIQIESLTIKNCNLKEIPLWIGQFKNLKKLNLENNNLTEFTKEIALLPKLEILNLNDNKIQVFPKEMSAMKSLNTLNLDNNDLNSLPIHIVRLQNLKSLSLKNNSFTKVPIELCVLTNLRYLYLNGNQIQSLILSKVEQTKEFKELKKKAYEIVNKINLNYLLSLKLKLRKNFLFSSFYKSDSYRILSIENCDLFLNLQLIKRNMSIFNLKRLTYLNISNNQIRTIPSHISKLESLNTLYAYGNFIFKVSKRILKLKNLDLINFNNNQLRSLPVEFKNLKNWHNKHLFIDDNFIGLDDPSPNEIGIRSLEAIYYVHLSAFNQYEKPLTLEKSLDWHSKQKEHWNIDKIKNFSVDKDFLNKASDITDKQLLKMFYIAIKPLIYKKFFFFDTKKYKIESDIKHEYIDFLLAKIKISNIQNVIDCDVIDDSTFDRIVEYFNSIYHDVDDENDDTENNIEIKNYLKLILLKYVEEIAPNTYNRSKLMLIYSEAVNLFKNSLANCISDQKEGLEYHFYTYVLGKEINMNFTLEKIIIQEIAMLKEVSFKIAALGSGFLNVHNLNIWKNTFEDILGINCDFEYSYNTRKSMAENKIGTVFQKFINLIQVDRVVDVILNKINANKQVILEAFTGLKDIVEKEHNMKYKSQLEYENENKERLEYYELLNRLEIELPNLNAENKKILELFLKLNRSDKVVECVKKEYFSISFEENATEVLELNREGLKRILIEWKILIRNEENIN